MSRGGNSNRNRVRVPGEHLIALGVRNTTRETSNTIITSTTNNNVMSQNSSLPNNSTAITTSNILETVTTTAVTTTPTSSAANIRPFRPAVLPTTNRYSAIDSISDQDQIILLSSNVNISNNNNNNNNNDYFSFDTEQFRVNLKTELSNNNAKGIEQLILTGTNYLMSTPKRQLQDLNILIILSWLSARQSSIFIVPSVTKALCNLLKSQVFNKIIKSITAQTPSILSNQIVNPYVFISQILWLAYQNQSIWPEEFIEAYVEDALNEHNWIDDVNCSQFVSNILTAFDTRPRTWKIDSSNQSKSTSSIVNNSAVIDETSNDSASGPSGEIIPLSESDMSIDDTASTSPTANLTSPRYLGRQDSIQLLLISMISKAKSSSTTTTSGSQPHETDKLLKLLELSCGLPEIRTLVLQRLDVWLQNPKLFRSAERLLIALCENITGRNDLTNGHDSGEQEDEILRKTMEQLLNLRFKIRATSTTKPFFSCIKEMLRIEIKLIDIFIRLIVQNELQLQGQQTTTGKNPSNMSLLQCSFQANQEYSMQILAYTIQTIIITQPQSISKQPHEHELLKQLRIFLRELIRFAKNDFDYSLFCMNLISMEHSLDQQVLFWKQHQTYNEPQDTSPSSSQRLLKRLLDYDVGIRERFFFYVCDLISMIILVAAVPLLPSTSSSISSSISRLVPNPLTYDQWLLYIQRASYIQFCCCKFFLYIIPKLFDYSNLSQRYGSDYVSCLYKILFTDNSEAYLRSDNWPPIEQRGDLFRLSSEIPQLGETLVLLVHIGLSPQTPMSSHSTIELIELILRRTLSAEQKIIDQQQQQYLRVPQEIIPNLILKLFELSRYTYPQQIIVPQTYQPPNLAVTAIYWKCCLICLLLASHDTRIFGKYIWENMAQVKIFMEMLLTGDYNYPPQSWLSSLPNPSQDKFYMNELIMLRTEEDLILELEQFLASRQTITRTNSELLGKVCLLDKQTQPKRPFHHYTVDKLQQQQPSQGEKQFYEKLQALNSTFKLSSMLCRCRSPDYILDILNRKQQQEKTTTSWLAGLIDSNIDCLNIFPIICLCDYFQHIIMTYKTTKTNGELPQRKTLNALETIIQRFHTIIKNIKQQHEQVVSSSNTNVGDKLLDDPVLNDVVCIFDYFFKCLNSKSSVIRLNAWQCLHMIVDDTTIDTTSTLPFSFSSLILSSDHLNIENFLSTIKTFRYFQTHLSPLIKRSLVNACHLETNPIHLHHYTLFIIENYRLDNYDLLCDLSLAFIKRHNVLLSLLELDKEKKYQLTIALFEFFSMHLLKMFQQLILDGPLKLDEEETISTTTTTLSSSSKWYFSLPVESKSVLNDIYLNLKKIYSDHDFLLNILEFNDTPPKFYHISIEPHIVEFLIIFLSNFDFNNKNEDDIQTAQPLKQLFFPTISSTPLPCFTSIKQEQEKQQKAVATTTTDESHFYQFSINDNDGLIDMRTTSEPTRKRLHSSSPTRSSKHLATSSIVHNTIECQRNIFTSDDVQHFIYKSKNSEFVKIFVQHANLTMCLKLIKTFNVPYVNICYVCSRLDILLNESNLSLKELNHLIKQSPFLLPIVNAWINEQIEEAIQLGQTLTKIIEKKKLNHPSITNTRSEPLTNISQSLTSTISKSLPIITSVQQPFISTTSLSSSINHYLSTYNRRINDLCNHISIVEQETTTTSSDELTLTNKLTNTIQPWKDKNECEDYLKRLFDKKLDRSKRRRLLTEIQWITNLNEQYRLQLIQAMINRCKSNDVKRFVNGLNEYTSCSLALLAIAFKPTTNDQQINDECLKLLTTLKHYETQGKSAFGLRLRTIKRPGDQTNIITPLLNVKRNLTVTTTTTTTTATTSIPSTNINQQQSDALSILCDYYPVRDYRIEKNFEHYIHTTFPSNRQDDCKRLLINLLCESEDKLSESTIGMLLDHLSNMENLPLSSPMMNYSLQQQSIYASRSLFSQHSRTSISQRLLLKQFLHSCDWTTIVDCIYDLLTLHSSPSQQSQLQTPNTPTHLGGTSLVNPYRSSPNTQIDSPTHYRLTPTQPIVSSRCSLLECRDSVLILDMLQSYLKLPQLWVGRESKMLERCNDEPLVELKENHIYTLILYILDEAYRLNVSKSGNIRDQYVYRYALLCSLIKSKQKYLLKKCLNQILVDSQLQTWTKDILPSFYYTLYLYEPNLFDNGFYLTIQNLFGETKQQSLLGGNSSTQHQLCNECHYDLIIHDLLVRLNSFDLLTASSSSTATFETNLLLRQIASAHPFIVIRHLNVITSCIQSRSATLRINEYKKRDSKYRSYFLSIFDLIERLQPYIFDQTYSQQLQTIVDIYIKICIPQLSSLLSSNLSTAVLSSNYLSDLIYLIDHLLNFIYTYLTLTKNNHQLLRNYHSKFFEKLKDKIQQNNELLNVLTSNQNNSIMKNLSKLKILNDSLDQNEDTMALDNQQLNQQRTTFDVRLCLIDRNNDEQQPHHQMISGKKLSLNQQKYDDVQRFVSKLNDSNSIDIEEILSILYDLKQTIDRYSSVDILDYFVECLTNLIQHENKQIREYAYEFILKYLQKYPQRSQLFSTSYIKCLTHTDNVNIFQTAIEHFQNLIIYYRKESNDLLHLILKYGLINKIDVTLNITQAIRLLNLYKYDQLSLNISGGSMLVPTQNPLLYQTTNTISTNIISE